MWVNELANELLKKSINAWVNDWINESTKKWKEDKPTVCLTSWEVYELNEVLFMDFPLLEPDPGSFLEKPNDLENNADLPNEKMDEWMSELMNEWMNEWMNGWINERMHEIRN